MAPVSVEALHEYLPSELEFLRGLVEIESPTPNKSAVDLASKYVAGRLTELGADVQWFRQVRVGDHLIGSWGTGPGGILLLVHLDTVHPIGTLKRLPFVESNGRLSGPGIMDMKASAAMALTAIQFLRESEMMPDRRISLLFSSDEETGSHTSQGLIRSQAQGHDLVLCLEPALPNGALKTWRKGIGMFKLEVQGRMAHAGANPSEGVNAIHELAHQIEQVAAIAHEPAGTTLNVNLVEGGTRSNVIPARAIATVDVRVQNEHEQQRVAEGFDALRPKNPAARLEINGEWNRPPMPRTQAMIDAFERAKAIGAALGLDLTEGGTGGGSDANFVAPLGVPVLDGLGAIGGGAHTEKEFIQVEHLPERTALLAAILVKW